MIEQNKSAEEIAETLNFSSPAYFRKVFRNVTGMLPAYIKRTRRGTGKNDPVNKNAAGGFSKKPAAAHFLFI